MLFFKRKKPKEKIIYRHTDGDFGTVVVTDKGSARFLKFGNHIKQGAINLKNPDLVYLKYQQAMLTVFEERTFERCLCLGLGVGAIPKYIHQNGLCQRLDVVEVNPKVVEVARNYFQFPQDVAVHTLDAMEFVTTTRKMYDLVFVDIFNQSGTPAQFKALSFYQKLYGLLRAKGVVAVNMWSSDFSDLLLQEKLETIFSEVNVVKKPGSKNHITLCSRAR